MGQFWGLKACEFSAQDRFTGASGPRSDAETWVWADIIFSFFGTGVNLDRIFFPIGKNTSQGPDLESILYWRCA